MGCGLVYQIPVGKKPGLHAVQLNENAGKEVYIHQSLKLVTSERYK